MPPAVEEGLKYAKSHEWAKVDGDVATIGISDFAQACCLAKDCHFSACCCIGRVIVASLMGC
jgi:hypothetical protein